MTEGIVNTPPRDRIDGMVPIGREPPPAGIARRAPPSLAEIEEIVRWPDPEVRNLKITLAYHDLELAFIHSLGERNVRWTAFAVWASRTAGSFIRGEELPKFLRDWLKNLHPAVRTAAHAHSKVVKLSAPERGGHGFIIDLMERIYNDVSTATAEGNLKVFAELGPLFSRFIDLLDASPGWAQEEIDRFTAELKPGPVATGGQDLLKRAFENYYFARHDRDEDRKAQLIYLANNLVGLHEQARLQSAIAAALNAPIADIFVGATTEKVHQTAPTLMGLLGTVVEKAVEFAVRPIARGIEEEWHDLATAYLMRMPLPDVTLDLGKDIPPVIGLVAFPPNLSNLTEPELMTLLGGINRAGNSLANTAAKDWVSLLDRMNTIVNLFRSRQQQISLYTPPFNPEQIADIRAGKMPSGDLG